MGTDARGKHPCLLYLFAEWHSALFWGLEMLILRYRNLHFYKIQPYCFFNWSYWLPFPAAIDQRFCQTTFSPIPGSFQHLKCPNWINVWCSVIVHRCTFASSLVTVWYCLYFIFPNVFFWESSVSVFCPPPCWIVHFFLVISGVCLLSMENFPLSHNWLHLCKSLP